MKYLNLNLFKRILLQVLLITVHMTYGIPAKAYTISTNATTCPGTSGNMMCLWLSSWGANFIQYGTSYYYSLYTKVCLCMSTAELNSYQTKCRAVACSTKYPNTNGNLRWDLQAGGCVGTVDCRANSGYYGYSSTYASPCPAGSYCPGNGFMVSQNGINMGWKYACEKGYYQNQTGKSTCITCPSDYTIPGTTAGTGTSVITNCYIASNTTVTDNYTNKYVYVKACYYT